MITVETPLHSVHTQRDALLRLAIDLPPDAQGWIQGALAVLWWMEHGGDTPIEMAASELSV